MSVNTQILFICGLDAAITLRISQIANELTIKCMQIKIIKFLGQKKVKYVEIFMISEICQYIRVLHKEFILVCKAIIAHFRFFLPLLAPTHHAFLS